MASINIFLKLKLRNSGLVKGPSKTPGHEDELLIDTFNWGETNQTPLGGKGRALQVRDLQLSKAMCKGSPQLILAVATNDVMQEAVICFRGSNTEDKHDFLKWTLTEGQVSSYEVEANSNNLIPLERFALRFKTLKVEYTPRDAKGVVGSTVSTTIDVAAGTGSG